MAIFGPAIGQIPLNPLRLVIGTLLLVFGLQWLRKAVLRASGHKALHDEAAIYRRHLIPGYLLVSLLFVSLLRRRPSGSPAPDLEPNRTEVAP